MKSRALVFLATLDVTWVAVFVPPFIWKLQFTAPRNGLVFADKKKELRQDAGSGRGRVEVLEAN